MKMVGLPQVKKTTASWQIDLGKVVGQRFGDFVATDTGRGTDMGVYVGWSQGERVAESLYCAMGNAVVGAFAPCMYDAAYVLCGGI